MDIEKVYDELDRLTKELRRLNATDENYRSVSENMERLSRIAGDYEKRDLDRINNNVRNDIQEEQLKVDMAKVKTDRMREWFGLVKTSLSIGASIGMGVIAYKGEVIDFKLPIRTLWDGAKNLLPRR